jgi:[ribosomal protein S5]-alanine N-acetyltransferase
MPSTTGPFYPLPADEERRLSTPNLQLTPAADADAEAIYALLNVPELAYPNKVPPSPEHVRADLEQNRKRWGQHSHEPLFQWVARHVERGVLVGWLTAKLWENNDGARIARLEGHVDPDAQRQGYGREAHEAILEFFARRLGVTLAQADIDSKNHASQAFVTSLGYRRVSMPGIRPGVQIWQRELV